MTHVLTLIAAPTTALPAAEIATRLGVTQWQWLEEGRVADLFVEDAGIDLSLRAQRGNPDDSASNSAHWIATSASPPRNDGVNALVETLATQRIDTIFQPVEGRRKRLLISDMDSTMIHQECIDELADCVGLKAHVAAITERAMNGELDFKQALRERVGLLKGLPETALQEVFDTRITAMQGARTLVQTMKKNGAYTLLVSGGFTFFTQRVATLLGFDAEEANSLRLHEGKLTGEVGEPILDKESKRAALHAACAAKHVAPPQVLAVGDGANDLPMLLTAGLGVAYHAKPSVQQQAQHRINHNDLTALLFAQGYAKSAWVD